MNVLKKILEFFGIIVSRQTKHLVHLRRRFFLWVLAGVFLLILLNIGVYTYSTHPNFCRSCHIMEPYYQAWTNSKHYSKAVCVDCHYPPSSTFGEHLWHKFQASSQVAKYVTQTYNSKPYAVVEDASCLRSGCHSKNLLEGKILTLQGLRFNHAPHLNRKNPALSCTSCHSQVVVGTHIQVVYDTCYLCHFKGQGKGRDLYPIVGCEGCHEVPNADIHKNFAVARGVDCQNCHVDVVQGDGHAPKERCVECHNTPGHIDHYEDTKLLHEKHITGHKATCQQCHGAMTHKVKTTLHPEISESLDCSLCHAGMHAGQEMLYKGLGGLGVQGTPSPMYHSQVDCVGCHLKLKPMSPEGEGGFAGKTYEPTSQGCVNCHGEDYISIYEMWKESLRVALEKTQKKLEEAEAYFKKHPEKETGSNQNILKEAQHNYRLVKDGRGIHNPDYAEALLRHACEQLDTLLKSE